MKKKIIIFIIKNTFDPKDLEAKSEENWSISAITFYLLIDFRLMHKKISYAIFLTPWENIQVESV
ncbi:hypothetical protein [Comamonas aquatica]|uniref:hypothetical protein n=1 Tax=Comamonas aquatica TaxID=225991 RepID=UPI001F326304|nr:hypothetical protein [Comamonas aquatica]